MTNYKPESKKEEGKKKEKNGGVREGEANATNTPHAGLEGPNGIRQARERTQKENITRPGRQTQTDTQTHTDTDTDTNTHKHTNTHRHKSCSYWGGR